MDKLPFSDSNCRDFIPAPATKSGSHMGYGLGDRIFDDEACEKTTTKGAWQAILSWFLNPMNLWFMDVYGIWYGFMVYKPTMVS